MILFNSVCVLCASFFLFILSVSELFHIYWNHFREIFKKHQIFTMRLHKIATHKLLDNGGKNIENDTIMTII